MMADKKKKETKGRDEDHGTTIPVVRSSDASASSQTAVCNDNNNRAIHAVTIRTGSRGLGVKDGAK